MQVTLEIPESYLANDSPKEFGRRITLYAALLMFRSGELSAGAAAELAGLDRFAFAEECRRHEIAMVDYPATDLHDEIASLEIPS